MPGKLLTPLFLNTLKSNISNILSRYYGVSVAVFRLADTTKNLYGDLTSRTFTSLGSALLYFSTQDLDVLRGTSINLESVTPISVILDPEFSWEEHDEVVLSFDVESGSVDRRMEIVKILAKNVSGVCLYKTANLAPVREVRA